MLKKNGNLKKMVILLSVTVLAFVIAFFVGKSLSLFAYSKEGTVTNIITFKGLEARILNSGNDALNLANAYPVYDSDGLAGTPFEFTITNTSSNAVSYTLKIENDTDKQQSCTVNGNPCEALSTNYIRYSYSIADGSYSTPANLGTANGILFTDQLAGEQTKKISILLWIDQDAPNSVQGKYFFGKVILEATQQQ